MRWPCAVTSADLLRLEEWFIQRFVDSFDEPPIEITLDIAVFDDPTHGQGHRIKVWINDSLLAFL